MASFKTDESFLEKIAIGAIGTRQVFRVLRELGHTPIELERGSMNYKIWKKIKIKRIRVPDILCIDNGVRIESRAKTKLEISMSHSAADPERGWDYGMKDNDYVALVVCSRTGDEPIDWTADNLVQFVSVRDMREAQREGLILQELPKGAQEGFESRLIWPCSIASAEGIVTQIAPTVKYRTEIRTNFVKLAKKDIELSPQLGVDSRVVPNQILASVVNISQAIPTNHVNSEYYIRNLRSLNLSERYAAAKALSFFNEQPVIDALLAKIADNDEHIYIKLESAASLCRLGVNEGYVFIERCLHDEYLQNVLESVIILAEIKTLQACEILSNVLLDDTYDPEIRAGAAWGLGEQCNVATLNALVTSFNFIDENIRVEAARALAKLTQNHSIEVVNKFATANANEKPGISWALTKSQTLTLEQLIPNLTDLNSRQWISYILGMQGEERFIKEIERLRETDREVYFATTLLWKILTSWVHDLKEY